VSDRAVSDGEMFLRCAMASMATTRMRQEEMQSSRQLSHWSAMRSEKYALRSKAVGISEGRHAGLAIYS